MPTDFSRSRVAVTGGAGFLGRVVCHKLRERGCREVLVPRRAEYDLARACDVRRMYEDLEPQIVLHLAAEVGGIGANLDNPGRFFYANMAMALHLIEQARISGLEKFVQVGTICAYPKFARIGCIMAYVPDRTLMHRRAAFYVDKIFKGANPGDLPVERPTKYKLMVNLKVAKAIGITIPPSILLRATEVIE